MKITILNGDMDSESGKFTQSLHQLKQKLEVNHEVVLFDLAQMNLKYCVGCWTCWWKTPGECVIKDDAPEIFREVIHSDFLIFASPIMAGFTSSLLKKITDRLIVLLHPYIEFRQKESHHRKRYPKYPDMGVIVEKEPDTDDEDLEIITDIYRRMALNFHAELKYVRSISSLNNSRLADFEQITTPA